MNKISAAIITLNEAEKIGRCLDSLQGIVDEIVVVDSFSADATPDICRQFGVRFFQENFSGFTVQKNRAAALCTHDYILSIDADEALSETLRQSIIDARASGLKADAYRFSRLNFVGRRPVKTCGWYPDRKIRLYDKTKGGWQGGMVHEKLEMNPKTVVQNLEGDLLHYTYKNAAALSVQAERFARLAAADLKQQATGKLLMKMIFSPAVRFIKSFVWRLGFTDGRLGWEICRQQARETFLKYLLALKSERQ